MPLREGDAEQRGRVLRVVEEHLVEVAHPVEEDGVRDPALHLEVLPEHRCDAGKGCAHAGASIAARRIRARKTSGRAMSHERALARHGRARIRRWPPRRGADLRRDASGRTAAPRRSCFPPIARALAAAGLRLEDCDRIAVCAGPGLVHRRARRAGHGLGARPRLGIPVEAVSTLEALAEAARPLGTFASPRFSTPAAGSSSARLFDLSEERARLLARPTRMPRETRPGLADGSAIAALPRDLVSARRARAAGEPRRESRASGIPFASRGSGSLPTRDLRAAERRRGEAWRSVSRGSEPYRLRPAGPFDLDEVARIEAESFPVPWKREFFASELVEPHRYIRVLGRDDGGLPRIGGYLFAVSLYEEFHINKIATDAQMRKRGLWPLAPRGRDRSRADDGIGRHHPRGARRQRRGPPVLSILRALPRPIAAAPTTRTARTRWSWFCRFGALRSGG